MESGIRGRHLVPAGNSTPLHLLEDGPRLGKPVSIDEPKGRRDGGWRVAAVRHDLSAQRSHNARVNRSPDKRLEQQSHPPGRGDELMTARQLRELVRPDGRGEIGTCAVGTQQGPCERDLYLCDQLDIAGGLL